MRDYHLFLYFTILTNALTCVYFIVKGLYIIIRYGKSDLSFRKSTRSEVPTLLCNTGAMDRCLDAFSVFTTICMFIVCLVFWSLLAAGYNWGWNLKTLFSLFDHLVVPVLKIVDFYYFTPLNTSKKVIYTSCILYPFVYYIATTIYGLASSEHYYPYWFMNPQRISYVWIVVFFISFLFLFLGIIYAFTQFMAYIRRKRADTQMPLIIE